MQNSVCSIDPEEIRGVEGHSALMMHLILFLLFNIKEKKVNILNCIPYSDMNQALRVDLTCVVVTVTWPSGNEVERSSGFSFKYSGQVGFCN